MKVTGVIHMHSTHSYDGKLSLQELRELLLSQGHAFACMTEHTDYLTEESAEAFVRECDELSDEQFVFVPGFEVPYKDAHVLHIGAREFVCDFANAEQLKDWRVVAPVVVLAHPVRNKFVVDETLLSVIDGVEVWNQQYEGKLVPRTRSVQLHTELSQQKQLLVTGGLDFHRLEHLGSPWVEMELENLSGENIIKTLQSGTFSFGTAHRRYVGNHEVKLTTKERLVSLLSIVVILLGKGVSTLLSKVGLKMPGFLRRFIRRRL